MKTGNTQRLEVSRPLTDAERLDLSAEQITLLDKIQEKERQAKEAAARAKEEIKKLRGEEAGVRSKLRGGKAYEYKECREEADLERGVASWVAIETGEVAKEEVLSPQRLQDLRQMRFEFDQKEEARKSAEKEKKAREKKEAAEAAAKAPALAVVKSFPQAQKEEIEISLPARALALSREGKSHAQVGEVLGVDRNRAYRLIQKGLAGEAEIKAALEKFEEAAKPFGRVSVQVGNNAPVILQEGKDD